jgi:hypothetical protein
MKNTFTCLALAAIALLGGLTAASAQTETAALATNLLNAAQSSADTQLGSIASELVDKLQAFEAAGGTNSALTAQMDAMLKSLTGGEDSAGLTSAFKLATAAKLTPEQVGLAKQVGNLASAYAVQKNFATLDGSQSDVATIVSSLRSGQVTTAIPALQNVAKNASLTDPQKQLLTTVANKYAPGLNKAAGALDSLKKLPGF